MDKPEITYEQFLSDYAQGFIRRSALVDRLTQQGVPWESAIKAAGLAHIYKEYLEEKETDDPR